MRDLAQRRLAPPTAQEGTEAELRAKASQERQPLTSRKSSWASFTPTPGPPSGGPPTPTRGAFTGDFSRIRASRDLPLQAKGEAEGSPDAEEREADRVADHLAHAPARPTFAPPRILGRHGGGQGTAALPASVQRTLAQPGRPLEPALRRDMEGRFQQDFSRVRVHADAGAAHSARDVGALAYTVGPHVVFGAGRFAPATREGRRLLTHELTHVVQQGSARRLQRAPDPEAQKRLKKQLEILSAKLKESATKRYAQSIAGDIVRSDLRLGLDYHLDEKTEKHGDSTLRTLTLYLLIHQKPDPKDEHPHPDTPYWTLVVDRQTFFTLHGTWKGRLHVRDVAQLKGELKGKSPEQAAQAAAASVTPQPDPIVVFTAPRTLSVPLKLDLKQAGTYAKFAAQHPLLSLSASAKQRVKALEKLLPKDATPKDPPAATPKPGATAKPRKQKQRVQEPVEVPQPDSHEGPSTQLEPQPQVKEGPGEVEIESESEPKDHEDHWYDGLLRALGVLLLGVAILAVAALVVIGVVYLATGVVISVAVAVAVAGAFLLGWALGTALRKRLKEEAYKGHPGQAIGRAFLDAIGITGLQEAWTGREVGTGRKLSDGERTERGILGGVNLLALLLGARGALKDAPVEPSPGLETSPEAPKPPAPTPEAPQPAPESVPKETQPTSPGPAPDPAPAGPAPAPEGPAPDKAQVPSEDAPPKQPKSSKAPRKGTRKSAAAKGPRKTDTPPTEGPSVGSKDATPDADSPKSKPKDAGEREPARKGRAGSRAKTAAEDPQRGVREALDRHNAKIKASRAELIERGKELSQARREVEALKQRTLDTPRNDPSRPSLLDEFQKRQARLKELEAQQKNRVDLDQLDRQKRDQLQRALDDETYARPTPRESVRKQVWEQAKADGGGKVLSPSGKEIPDYNSDWVLGHRPKYEFWKHQLNAAERGISRDQFIEECNRPEQYRPETPEDNSSHAYEDKTDTYVGPGS